MYPEIADKFLLVKFVFKLKISDGKKLYKGVDIFNKVLPE